MQCDELQINNSVFVRLVGLALFGVPINDATCTMTLKTKQGEPLEGAEDLPLEYVEDTAGVYRGTIPHTVSLTENATYLLSVTATKSGVGVGNWESAVIAKRRRFT